LNFSKTGLDPKYVFSESKSKFDTSFERVEIKQPGLWRLLWLKFDDARRGWGVDKG
jgi:hypothetical protein